MVIKQKQINNMEAKFSDLLGKTLVRIDATDETIYFETKDDVYEMYHEQDCCERVAVDDIEGDFEDILNSEITMADESSNQYDTSDCGDSVTWTFYRLATIKGYVNITWKGESNGYYSERVNFIKIK